ncbi:hypothetical protein B0H67DRAFT_554352 [Lasiosphaeris hirsuta]|uniref:Uncharacterized protein n=1 Tax=Lasiosphaeris hirsuta TaxID=260670 RepID=A0AA40DWS4_9PEZI|nr:hypothetical protein B0H67DRAFT_554352 [Lasiosphaeris hirsuta]
MGNITNTIKSIAYREEWTEDKWAEPTRIPDQQRVSWGLRVPRPEDKFDAPDTAKQLVNSAADYSSMKYPGMTSVPTTNAERYPWIVQIFARKLEETEGETWSGMSAADEDKWGWYIPTMWMKGTAWFAKGANAENSTDSPVYLFTAAHNLVSRVPASCSKLGGYKGASLTGHVETPPEGTPGGPDVGMFDSRALADSVYVVAWERTTSANQTPVRISGWADRASVPAAYLAVDLRDAGRMSIQHDVAALRLHVNWRRFPPNALQRAPYIAAIPRSFTTTNAITKVATPLPFASLGIPGNGPDKKPVSNLVWGREPPTSASPGKLLSIFDFPSINIAVRQPPPPGAGQGGRDRRFNSLLVAYYKQSAMSHGLSGGPGIMGELTPNSSGERPEYVVCCNSLEWEQTNSSIVVPGYPFMCGGAIFCVDTTINAEFANPLVLLEGLGCTGLIWQPGTINGFPCHRLTRQ